jgi:hypothetical protein
MPLIISIRNSRSGNEPVEELDGAAALEPAVAARGEPHLAHAAAANQPIECVPTDQLAGKRRAMALGELCNFTWRILQESGRIQRIAFGEQIAQCCSNRRLRRGQPRQPALAFIGLELERPIQMTAELTPQRWIEGRQAHAPEV